MTKTMDELCVNTIRALAMDAVQRANSAPGNADGAGAGGLLPVATVPALRADMARVARSITYVTFSDPDALAAEHDGVLCLEAGGAWNSARTAAELPHDDTLLWRARAGERGD